MPSLSLGIGFNGSSQLQVQSMLIGKVHQVFIRAHRQHHRRCFTIVCQHSRTVMFFQILGVLASLSGKVGEANDVFSQLHLLAGS